MADGKISVDVDKLYQEKASTNGKANGNGIRKYSLDELMGYDAEQTLLEKMKKRGEMSVMDIYMLNKMEREDRLQQQSPIDVEAIIEKATAPFREQLAEMKRQQEKAEQDKKFDALQARIDKLTDALANGNNNKSDPIMDEIKGLKSQLADEKEKAAKKDMDDFKQSMRDTLDGISDEIFNLRSKGTEKTKSDIERLEELQTMQERYRKALGFKDSKDDEASTADVLSTGIDMFNQKAPALMKTVGTLREGLKGGSDLPDDVPMMDNIPTQLPSRNTTRTNRSTIPADILQFLEDGKEKDGGFVDLSGVQWQNEFNGKPLTRADIEAKAITDPESVRALMQLAYEDAEKMRKQKPKTPAKEPEPEPEPEKIAVPETHAEPEETEQEAPEPDDPLEEAVKYIESGEEKTDDKGVTAWVGNRKEIYESDDGPMTKEQMLAEAKADPKGFMATVKEHLDSLDK